MGISLALTWPVRCSDVGRVGTRNDLALVDAVEVAYRLGPDRATWLASLMEAVGPSLGGGAGVIGFLYDVRRPVSTWFAEGASSGLGPSETSFVAAQFAEADRTDVGRIRRRLPMTSLPRFGRLSEFLGGPTRSAEETQTLVSRLGVLDVVGVHAPIDDARGVLFNVFETDKRAVPRARVPIITKLASHVSAAGRLRELGGGRSEAAVFRADGRLLHADPAVAPSRVALGERVRAWVAARSANEATDAATRLDAWTPLVEGRWSLVERLESDGRRFVVVHENAPDLPDPRALTARERAVVQLVALGDSNKHVAYELGLPLGTVAHALHSGARKLGVRSRAELVRHVRLLLSGSVERVEANPSLLLLAEPRRERAPAPLSALSAAERAVALLAARGERSEAIARARGTTLKTVSNQLSHIYAKLGAKSRADLARILLD